MKKILVTGMSGPGRPTAPKELGRREHRVLATDTDDQSHWVTLPDGFADWS
jgi:hypothetical protein